jgi:hypothetical protein
MFNVRTIFRIMKVSSLTSRSGAAGQTDILHVLPVGASGSTVCNNLREAYYGATGDIVT